MLYEYASLDYLKKLHLVVTQLIDGVVDPLLTVAASQQRDALLTNPQWGTRDTSDNWANNAWPFLKDLQASLSKDIAMRAFDKYKLTATDDKLRGAEQFSTLWLTPEEEREYQAAVALVNAFASRIDNTFDPQVRPRWNDYNFAYNFGGFQNEKPRIPKFRILPDLTGETGKLPPRTGVYMAVDDPNAALQFAAAGNDGIKLREASTFNDIGLDALKTVGREHLWFDQDRMFDFATKSRHAPLFVKWLTVSGTQKPKLAPSAVAAQAFTTVPAKWVFVEIVADDYEDTAIPVNGTPAADVVQRLAGGEVCTVPGFYFSPARTNSRQYFKSGDRMPTLDANYGQTIWQWDADQS